MTRFPLRYAHQNILVGEGNPARIRGLLSAERKKHVRIGGEEIPVHEIVVGTGEGEVKRFDVPGVPGAEGFDVYGQQGLIGRNVAFKRVVIEDQLTGDIVYHYGLAYQHELQHYREGS